jgi:MoxR-like ATPase
MENLVLATRAVQQAMADASHGLVERESLVELVVLCAVAREHMLVIGPPGTAKSQAVRRIASRLGGNYFEYLIGRFTEPNEIFGPVNLRKLKEGIVETDIAGMLPTAEIAFLDEVFLGSTAILNTLLGLLNERIFRRGHTVVTCPLRVCVGAANRLPTEDQLAAFADRFLVRTFVAPLGDSALESLLTAGWEQPTAIAAAPTSLLTHIDALADCVENCDLRAVQPSLAHAVRQLRAAGIDLSDRRVVRSQRLIAAAAVLSGRTAATAADLWPIVFALPTEAAQTLGRATLSELLAQADSAALTNAALDASHGMLARSSKIVARGDEVFKAAPAAGASDNAWRLQIESIAREIDATFVKDTMPTQVAHLRARIVEAIDSVHGIKPGN